MRRFLLLILLIAMPLQWSWAVAGSLCGHESGRAAQHFGHHSHDHAAQSHEAPAEKKSQPAGLGMDADCAYCHFFAAKAPAAVMSSLQPAPAGPVPALAAARFGSQSADEPERPKWMAAL